jgi:hypothetical protein
VGLCGKNCVKNHCLETISNHSLTNLVKQIRSKSHYLKPIRNHSLRLGEKSSVKTIVSMVSVTTDCGLVKTKAASKTLVFKLSVTTDCGLEPGRRCVRGVRDAGTVARSGIPPWGPKLGAGFQPRGGSAVTYLQIFSSKNSRGGALH